MVAGIGAQRGEERAKRTASVPGAKEHHWLACWIGVPKRCGQLRLPPWFCSQGSALLPDPPDKLPKTWARLKYERKRSQFQCVRDGSTLKTPTLNQKVRGSTGPRECRLQINYTLHTGPCGPLSGLSRTQMFSFELFLSEKQISKHRGWSRGEF